MHSHYFLCSLRFRGRSAWLSVERQSKISVTLARLTILSPAMTTHLSFALSRVLLHLDAPRRWSRLVGWLIRSITEEEYQVLTIACLIIPRMQNTASSSAKLLPTQNPTVRMAFYQANMYISILVELLESQTMLLHCKS